MATEDKLTSGMAGNMVAGEPASPIVTSNGVNKVSCIDPKSDGAKLDGFALPKSMGNGVPDGACTGASVCIHSFFTLLISLYIWSFATSNLFVF